MQASNAYSIDDAWRWLVQNYFPAAAEVTPENWTDWGVPAADDPALIQRMLNSVSGAAAFGNKASFAQLWDADPVALGRVFPDPVRPYDASSADAALAQHLAFWTRRDCQRMHRLMAQSKLVRPKWEREDYLPRTILKACAMQQEVLPPDPPPPQAPIVTATATIPAQSIVTGPAQHIQPQEPTATALDPAQTFLTPEDQQHWFKGCVYVLTLNKILIPGGHLLNQEQFNAMFGSKVFALDSLNQKVAKSAWDAFTHSLAVRFPWAIGLCFRPEIPPGQIIEESGKTLVNFYWPAIVPSTPGDVTPFLQHLTKLFPDERDRAIILAYMAALVQFPGDKFQWCPVVQGAEGNGKSLLLDVAENAIGLSYCHRPNANDLAGNGGKFTAWVMGRLLIGIEEIRTSSKLEVLEILKPMITARRIEIQPKGVDQFTGDNRANVMMFSNFKDAIPIRVDGRRYSIFYTPQQYASDIERDGMSVDYFVRLYGWLRNGGFAACTHFLKTYAIPAEFNPALEHGGRCTRAPATTSHGEALRVSMGAVEQSIVEAIESHEAGFCGGWVSSIMLERLLKERGYRGNITPQRQKEIMHSLGYVPHPALPEGRALTVLAPDGKRPLLFAKQESIQLNETRPMEVGQMYSRANMPAGFGAPTVIGQPAQQG